MPRHVWDLNFDLYLCDFSFNGKEEEGIGKRDGNDMGRATDGRDMESDTKTLSYGWWARNRPVLKVGFEVVRFALASFAKAIRNQENIRAGTFKFECSCQPYTHTLGTGTFKFERSRCHKLMPFRTRVSTCMRAYRHHV